MYIKKCYRLYALPEGNIIENLEINYYIYDIISDKGAKKLKRIVFSTNGAKKHSCTKCMNLHILM